MKQALSRFFKWVFMKKKEITDPKDLYFYHTKRVLVVLMLFMGISFVSALTFISLFQAGEMAISVPDVVGKSLVEAQLRLQQDELLYLIKTKQYTDKPEGIVLEQEPQGGSSTKKQRAIILFINVPAPAGTLPNLCGLGIDEARTRLAAATASNFKPVLGYQAAAPSDTVPAGKIISQTPAPGFPYPSPVTVSVLVSTGPDSGSIRLPDFRGQGVENALRWLALNDLTGKVVPTANAPAGSVSGQEPAAGTALHPGQLVTLTSGAGKSWGVLNLHLPRELKLSQLNISKPAETVTNSKLSDAEQKLKLQQEEQLRQQQLILSNPDQFKVTVRVEESGNSTTLLDEVKRPNDRILLIFPYTGTATMEILIDGKLFFTRRYR